jgi:hypothetical protein
MRLVQLTHEACSVRAESWKREETTLEVSREQGSVLQIVLRFPLGVQQRLHSLDDLAATRQEHLEQRDVRFKRRLDDRLRS